MEYGILIGAAVHLFMLAYMAGGRPHPELIREPVNACFLLSHAQQFFTNIFLQQGSKKTGGRVVVKADTNLYFPGVEKFRQVLNEATDGETCVLVDLSHVTEIDYTALKVRLLFLKFEFEVVSLFHDVLHYPQMLKSVASDYHKRGLMVLYFTNASSKVTKSISSALHSADIDFLTPNKVT
jgi:sodium-independent sulfate anion transporter 11